jgi:hypothetical protein
MKILILSLFFIPQHDTINIQELETSLIEFYNFKKQSEIIEYSQVEKFRFLKFLPMPSLVQIDGALRFQVSFSVQQIYGFAQEQAKREQTILSIEQKNKVELQKEIQKLRKEILSYNSIISLLEERQRRMQIDSSLVNIEQQLFDIEKSKYERNEISPSDFLNAQKRLITVKSDYSQKEFYLFQLDEAIKNKKNEIYEIVDKL